MKVLLLHWQQKFYHECFAVALAIAGWPCRYYCCTGSSRLAMQVLLLEWHLQVGHVDIAAALATAGGPCTVDIAVEQATAGGPCRYCCCTGNSGLAM